MHNKILHKYYFINALEKSNIDKQDKTTIIIYRDYKKKLDRELILKIKNLCKKKGIKFILANNIKLAINLNLDGAYIPSFNRDKKHLSYSYKKDFIILGSAHNIKEMRIKELQGVNQIFLSSIFKRNKNFLGIKKFKLFSLLTKKKIIVLGGISQKNLKLLNLVNCSGFAGISYFR